MNTYQRARASDPHTSHLAAEHVEKTGLADTQKRLVLEELKGCSMPVTSRELAFLGCIDRYSVARRLPELKDEGLVCCFPARKCRISKRQAITWTANV